MYEFTIAPATTVILKVMAENYLKTLKSPSEYCMILNNLPNVKFLAVIQRREEVVIESPHIIIPLCRKGGCSGCESFYSKDSEPYSHVQQNKASTWE